MFQLKPHGYTIIELLVSVLISMILMSAATPSILESIKNSKITAALNYFNGTLHFARSHAITHQEDVYLCPSTDGTNCSSNNDWSQGYVVYTLINDTPNVLKSSELDTNIIRFSSSNLPSSALITFTREGEISAQESRSSFTLCDSRGQQFAKALIINAIGRTQRAYDQNNDGIVEDHNGNNITC